MKVCPKLTVLPPDPERTEKASQNLVKMVAHYTPLWEPNRPGNIHLDLTGTERLWGKAKDMGYRLRKEVKTRLYLPGTVGVASNKMVAHIASRIMPSEAVLDVGDGEEASFMAPLPVNVIPGIGRFRKKILLEELNITCVRQLALLNISNLRLIFGMQAFVIHQRARGIDPTPVYPPLDKPLVSEEVTLSPDENDDRRLLGVLYRLVEKSCYRLRSRALFPQKAGLLIRYSDQKENKRQLTLPYSSFWDFDLYAPLEKLFFKACNRRTRVRLIRIWFGSFLAHPQRSLFSDLSLNAKKKSLVIKALDRIRGRYGEGAIGYGKTA
jgi:DNA polymerase-4